MDGLLVITLAMIALGGFAIAVRPRFAGFGVMLAAAAADFAFILHQFAAQNSENR